MPVDGGSTDPENKQATPNRTDEAIFRNEMQQNNLGSAAEQHRCGVEFACHQKGLASRKHIAEEATVDRCNNAQDDGGEWQPESQTSNFVRRLDRKQSSAKSINI